MLVHVGDGVYDEQTMATAVKLAARRRRGIHVLVTIIVPKALPIDAPLADAESAADTIIEQAKLQGGGRVSGHWEKVRAGQAGRRIIEEAQDMRATAVVMALPERVAGHVGVRQDDRDRARRAALPGDHRVAAAGAPASRGAARRPRVTA